MRGRALDIHDENAVIEGRTSEIFVSRSTLFLDAMDELLQGESLDFSLPLEVTRYLISEITTTLVEALYSVNESINMLLSRSWEYHSLL